MTSPTQLAVLLGALTSTLAGWALGRLPGAVIGLAFGSLVLIVPWRGQPLWRWAAHYLRRNQSLDLPDPVTVVNDRSAGAVRYQGGTAVAAVQVLGRAHRPTLLVGSNAACTANTLDIRALLPLMTQSLGLAIDSVSVVSVGSRRRDSGDYPRVYDSLLGTAPYAGHRETWLVVRIRALDNGAALEPRATVGAAALAAAQRISATLRRDGIRAKVATATDMVDLERRIGSSAVDPHNRRWHTLRGDGGWLTTYAYRPADFSSELFAQAWALRVDGIIQNVTVFPDGTACASVTTRTAQPPTAAASVLLRPLPGEQARALANSLCAARTEVRGQARGPMPAELPVAVGPSGVLLGKCSEGDRLLLPLSDPAGFTRTVLAADDPIAKRIIIRAAAAGERITLHTRDFQRWEAIRMPHLMVTDQPRPAPGTTLSVTDGTVSPAPRPAALVEVRKAGETGWPAVDVQIVQTGPNLVEVTVDGRTTEVEVEFFRAENRFASPPETLWAETALAEQR